MQDSEIAPLSQIGSDERDNGGGPDAGTHYLRRVLWKKVDNQWYGVREFAKLREKDTSLDRVNTYAGAVFSPAVIEAAGGRDVPQEILLVVVQCLVEQSQSTEVRIHSGVLRFTLANNFLRLDRTVEWPL